MAQSSKVSPRLRGLRKLSLCLSDQPIGALEEGLELVLNLAKIGSLRSLLLGVARFPRSTDFLKGLRSILAQAPSHLQLERDTWRSVEEESSRSIEIQDQLSFCIHYGYPLNVVQLG